MFLQGLWKTLRTEKKKNLFGFQIQKENLKIKINTCLNVYKL